jgi:hypothetical protein
LILWVRVQNLAVLMRQPCCCGYVSHINIYFNSQFKHQVLSVLDNTY